MLKFLFLLIFSIPLCWFSFTLIQEILLIMSVIFIFNLNSFFYLSSLGFMMGLDLMSFMLILLSLWICSLMLMSSESIFYQNYFKNLFLLNVLFMVFFLILSFSVLNIFLFYLFFESSLIPIFMMILGWGYQGERLQAGVYMLMYTLIGSLPLLLVMMMVYQDLFVLSWNNFLNLNFSYNWLIYLSLCIAFFVKMPMFLTHFWLPKAHVEAPVAGSMILAGVLLKLGGYGLIRVMPLLISSMLKYNFYFILISLLGGVLISLNCLIQSDMKLLIAFSSVGHMGIMMGGILSMSSWGLLGGLAMMLSHGLCSSGLFFLVNVKYERAGSRNFYLIKGMMSLMPKMSLWWFFFCVMNMAAPPSMNLLSEVCLINALVGWSNWSMISLMLMGFFAAGYSLYLFSFSQHGVNSPNLYNFFDSNLREYMILFMHWVPLNLLMLNFDLIILWL